MLSEGAPWPSKATPRSPKGPPRAAPSSPGDPPEAPGGSLGLTKAPQTPQEPLRAPKGDKRKHRFYNSDTYISAQGGARVNECQGFRSLLGSLLFLVCFCSFCFWFVVGAAAFIHLFAARLGLHLTPR